MFPTFKKQHLVRNIVDFAYIIAWSGPQTNSNEELYLTLSLLQRLVCGSLNAWLLETFVWQMMEQQVQPRKCCAHIKPLFHAEPTVGYISLLVLGAYGGVILLIVDLHLTVCVAHFCACFKSFENWYCVQYAAVITQKALSGSQEL